MSITTSPNPEMQNPNRARTTVAIIGAGYAGAAAAVTLTERGVACHVFEAGIVPGGRARRVTYHGVDLDNGQHILLGAYRELLQLMQTVGAPRDAFARLPLTLNLHPGFSLRTLRLPAPLHLAAGLFTARGLTWNDRFAAIRFANALKKTAFTVSGKATVADLFALHRQTETVINCLWQPLCIAALNTPIDRASGQVFANIIRDAFFRNRTDSDLLLPRVDLSALFPEPALRWLTLRGCRADLGSRIVSVSSSDHSSGGKFTLVDQHHATHAFDAVVCAVAPHQLSALAMPLEHAPVIAAFEPIYTVYLSYPQRVSLPFPISGRRRGLSQWLFDREALCGTPGLISAVISASGPHQNMDHDLIAQAVHGELEEIVGTLPAPVWHKVIAEKFATFSCEPDGFRPPIRTAVAGLFLAGDYVEGDYPSTLEGAVRSGKHAAILVQQFLSTGKI